MEHLDLVLLILLALSEVLAETNKTRANSVIQLVVQVLKKIKGKDTKVG